MIRFKFIEVAISKGYTNPHALSDATGIPYATCHKWFNDEPPQYLHGETLNKLCEALKVKPKDLIEYIPD